MKELKFSVLMCVYFKDSPEYFKIAVESILSQTHKPDEVVLVVDGEIPGELDSIVNTYSLIPDFHVVRLATNQGHGIARRTGFDNCKYPIIALMDADDISLPTRFEEELKYFEEDDSLDVVGGNIAEFIDAPTEVVGNRNLPTNDTEIKQYMRRRCPFNQVTVAFKKNSVLKAGGYLDWYCNEDYYLWTRMFLQGCKFANTGTTLVNVRVGKEMYGRRGGWKYFKSECLFQSYLLKNRVVGFPLFCINVIKRFVVQILLTNTLRGYAYRLFARSRT